jgi:hypothetical protein
MSIGVLTCTILLGVSALRGQSSEEPQAILIRSKSPTVARKVQEVIKSAGLPESAYRIEIPAGRPGHGSLDLNEIIQLERRVTETNKDFGKGSADIIVLVKVITKGTVMERALREALSNVDKSLYQLETVRGVDHEPEAILLKSKSPLVAQRVAEVVKSTGLPESAYRIEVPADRPGYGSLDLSEIVQLERTVTETNKDFGKGAADVIVLVKVITKGTVMERALREALSNVDKSLYQLETVRGVDHEPEAILLKSKSPLVAQRVAEVIKSTGLPESAYRIEVPADRPGYGSLDLSEIIQLERRVTETNKDFGKGSADVIVLVKVITKGTVMERALREALRNVDKSLYELEVVRDQ